jgi:predicted RNA-binding protein with PUA-like domain
MAKKQYWLMKSEPGAFSINDLEKSPHQTTCWDGVRNYQARNFMRDTMRIGDEVFFYHSGKNPSIVGICEVVRKGYPDDTAWDPESAHFDSKSTQDNPKWYMVDIRLIKILKAPISLKSLREVKGLENMMLLKKGVRLSVQPVSQKEYNIIMGLTS